MPTKDPDLFKQRHGCLDVRRTSSNSDSDEENVSDDGGHKDDDDEGDGKTFVLSAQKFE